MRESGECVKNKKRGGGEGRVRWCQFLGKVKAKSNNVRPRRHRHSNRWVKSPFPFPKPIFLSYTSMSLIILSH